MIATAFDTDTKSGGKPERASAAEAGKFLPPPLSYYLYALNMKRCSCASSPKVLR